MMNKDQMAKTAQLDQFDEELYKVCPLLSTSVSLNPYKFRCLPNSFSRSSPATMKNTSLPPPNNPSPPSTPTNGSNPQIPNSLSNTPATPPASVRKQALQDATCGASSAFTSSRRSSSSASRHQTSHGRCSRRWWRTARRSIRA